MELACKKICYVMQVDTDLLVIDKLKHVDKVTFWAVFEVLNNELLVLFFEQTNIAKIN